MGRVAGGEACCVSGERGIIAAGGLSSDGMSCCGLSTGGLSLKLSAGDIAIVDIDGRGASEMVPQPGAVDSSAAVIIHALSRNSKQGTLAGAIADLVNEHCMPHPKGQLPQ